MNAGVWAGVLKRGALNADSGLASGAVGTAGGSVFAGVGAGVVEAIRVGGLVGGV